MAGRAPGAAAHLGTGYLGPDRTPMATFLRLAGDLAWLRATAGKYVLTVKRMRPPPRPIEDGKLRVKLTQEVCDYWDVTHLELLSPRRTQHITDARAVLYFLLHEDAHMSFSAIGRYLEKDHSSVIHGHRKANRQSIETIRGKVATEACS